MVRETRLLLLLGALLPCSSYANSAFPPVVTRATCIFQSDTVSGHVSFSRPVGAAAMTLQYDVEGLTPGEHKWHVHSYGDVSQVRSSARALSSPSAPISSLNCSSFFESTHRTVSLFSLRHKISAPVPEGPPL